MNGICSQKDCMIIAKKIIADVLSSNESKTGTESLSGLSERIYLELKETWDEWEVRNAVSYIRRGVMTAILSLSSEEPTREKVHDTITVVDNIAKYYGPRAGKFPNFAYPSEEHRMKEGPLTIDLFNPGVISSSTLEALSDSKYFLPLCIYVMEGLAPSWTGFVNNRNSRTMAHVLITRRKSFGVEITKYFIANGNSPRFDKMIAHCVRISDSPSPPFGSNAFNYPDLFSKFLADIPRVLSGEIEAIEKFLRAISSFEYNNAEEKAVVQLTSLINQLRELRGSLRSKLKGFTDFKESLTYYPKGVYGVLSFAEDVAILRPSEYTVISILELIRLHSKVVVAERVVDGRSEFTYNLLSEALVQFLRDYRVARVPSFLSEAIPEELARF